mmetsp:Transcript_36602/g.113933  ORF Transcript_36602/g.113933 Transcript_36602/m.113933 type:complete len:214 (-) Transcript_36602:34-675(-)
MVQRNLVPIVEMARTQRLVVERQAALCDAGDGYLHARARHEGRDPAVKRLGPSHVFLGPALHLPVAVRAAVEARALPGFLCARLLTTFHADALPDLDVAAAFAVAGLPAPPRAGPAKGRGGLDRCLVPAFRGIRGVPVQLRCPPLQDGVARWRPAGNALPVCVERWLLRKPSDRQCRENTQRDRECIPGNHHGPTPQEREDVGAACLKIGKEP